MEKYRELLSLEGRVLANRACALLEDAEIPLLVEHIERTVLPEERPASLESDQYRIFVPEECAQKASLVTQTLHSTRPSQILF